MAQKTSMTAKQQRFVDEYLVDLCAKRAAIQAGYSERTATEIGYETLRIPHVAQAIAKAMAARSQRTQIRQDDVLREIATLAFSDVTEFAVGSDGKVIVADDAPPNATRALAAVEREVTTGEDAKTSRVKTKVKLWDKPAALRMAAQHLGMFKQGIDLNVNVKTTRVIIHDPDDPSIIKSLSELDTGPVLPSVKDQDDSE